MQAILKLIQAFLWAWDFAKKHPKSATATAAAGLTGGAMMFSTVVSAPPLITAANTTNAPGSNGQVLESNGDNTYTFGDPSGVGGGATELAELDDVADTLAGAQGDFLGWDGADWDDIEVTLDTPTDVTITTPATKQTIRYNGSAWVNSQLASTDLSDFAATISGDSNDVLGWNGSAWDDVTISLGTLTDITNESSATDGLVLTANGDGTHTFESPSVGGLLTPDGNTAVEETDVYPVKAYGASGSGRIFRCTTSSSTVTTKDGSGGAVSHDFEVGHSLMLLRAGANCSVLKPAVANGSLTPGGTPGGTTYRMCFSAGDGNGGWTGVGASDYVETTTGAATVTATDYLEAKIPVPYGCPSVAVYFVQGTGAISTYRLVTVLEVRNKFLASGDEPAGGGTGAMPTATASNSGGFLLLTVPTGHGLTTGDVVNFHDTGNTEYNGQHVISGTTATTLTTSTAYGSAGATGNYQVGFVTYRYNGVATSLHGQWGMPNEENPHWNWRASIVRPRGNLTIDTVGARLYRSEATRGSRMSASAQPTWPSSADSIVLDGDHTMRRSLDFVSISPPSADVPGALFTTVATVPTDSTFTLTDAPTNAISSDVPYLLAHNDAPAWRAAFAAAEASGRGGTVTADGIQQMYFRKHTLDTNMSNIGTTTAPIHTAFSLRSGVLDVSQPAISVKLDPHCRVRAHYMQCDGLMEDMTGSMTAQSYYHLYHFGGEQIVVQGGIYEWNTFCGGLTEHECDDVSHAQSGSWCYDQGNSGSLNLGVKPQYTLISDCRIDWPNIGSSNGYAETDGFSYRKMTLRNVQLWYGGSDGDQTWSTNHGDWDVIGCEIWNTRRLGSHGFYWGINRNRMRAIGCTFKEVYKHSINLYGESNSSSITNVIISDCFGVNTGVISVGTTTNNFAHRVAISSCHGFSININGSRDVSVIGGSYDTITVNTNADRTKIYGLTVNVLSLSASSSQSRMHVGAINCRHRMLIGNGTTNGLAVDGIDFPNPHTIGTTYNSYHYEWIATGSNNEYYCRLRSTGGDPGISSPTAVRVRETITNTAGSLGSLANDTWYYGDPGALGYSTLVVKIGDASHYDPDENPYGEVASLTLGPAIAWGSGTMQNSKFRNIYIRKGLVDDRSTYFALSSGTACSLIDVLFDNCTFEHTGLAFNASGTVRMVDFGTAVMARCENVEFFKCNWIYPRRLSTATHSEVRMAFTRGGNVTFRECNMKCWGSGCEILAPAGTVHLIGNKIQDNVASYAVSTSDTFTHSGSGITTDLGSSTSDPVMVRAGVTSSALPVSTPQIAVDTIYYRNNSTLKLYLTSSDAASDTSPIDITTANGPVLLTFLNSAHRSYMSAFEFLGDTTSPDIYGEVRDNIWRGSPAATYAQIGSNQSNYQLLPLVNTHRLSSDASREIDGFNAPGAGSVWRKDRFINVGAQDIVIKDNTDTDSAAENRVESFSNADVTYSANELWDMEYDNQSLVNRLFGYTP